jgi:hypothetical protein
MGPWKDRPRTPMRVPPSAPTGLNPLLFSLVISHPILLHDCYPASRGAVDGARTTASGQLPQAGVPSEPGIRLRNLVGSSQTDIYTFE